MRFTQLRLLACIWALLAAAGRSSASPPVQLTSVRLIVSGERTRLDLSFSSDRYAFSVSSSGDSLQLVRLTGVALGRSCKLPRPAQGLLRQMRVISEKKGPSLSLRLVTSRPARAQVYRAGKTRAQRTRMIIDLLEKKGVRAQQKEPSLAQRDAPRPPSAAALGKGTPQGPPGVRVVVIDPGHGGSDPGAVREGLHEKEICLDVARRLASALNSRSGVRAVLTRGDDRLLPLPARMRQAEKENADLFVSIHVNAAPSRAAHGVEVYFLSLGAASDAASREVARLENEADPDYVLEKDAELEQLPFLVDLRQSDTLLRSSRAAELVLDLLTQRKLAEARGVKQAGFAVLKSFQVPSVLVELGFVSSPQDRKQLKDPTHRQELAQALCDGVRLYFERYAPHDAGAAP